MKVSVCLLFVFAFAVAILSGEGLCCTDIDAPTSMGAHFETLINHHDSHHSDSQSHTEHQCVGCLHTPILSVADGKMDASWRTIESQFLDFKAYIPDPFLSLPFQPPKA